MRSDRYECDLCGESFDTETELKRHLKKYHTKKQ